jgi:hypothetical protein
MMADAAFHLRRFTKGKSDREGLSWIFRDCYAYTFPIRGARFSTGGAATSNNGQTESSWAATAQADLMDSTGTDSARILAAALKDGGMPATSQWFEFDVDNADDDAKLWLDQSARKLWKLIHGSNFDAVAFECLIDEVACGQSVMFVTEGDAGGFQFEQWEFADCVFSCSKAGGPVDTIYREYTLTAEQAISEFGPDRVSAKVRDAMAHDPSASFCFVYCIYPRDGQYGPFALNMPFAELVIERDTAHLVREGGYNEFPCVVPRWMMLAGTPYGIGPAYVALPDMRQLNKTIQLQILGLEVHAGAGTYKAIDDGVFNPHNVRLGSRKVLVVGDMDNLQPLGQAGNLQATLLDIERLQKSIRKVFMADALEPANSGPARTATEINVRVDLIRQQLGPMYGRQQAELHMALIARCFAMALRAGALGVPPRSLVNVEYRIKFTSPLARAQQLADVQAIDTYLNSTMALDAVIDPSALDNVDVPKLNKIRAERLGVPRDGLRKQSDIDEMRANRAKQQAAQEAEQAGLMAAQAKDAGQPTTAAGMAAAGGARLRLASG